MTVSLGLRGWLFPHPGLSLSLGTGKLAGKLLNLAKREERKISFPDYRSFECFT